MNVPSHYQPRGASAREIAASVEGAITDGRLWAGATLPTVRALADRLGVSPTTVASAYRSLRQRGIAAGQGRRGTRIALRPPLPTRPPLLVAAGVRNLADGNPDPGLLPDVQHALGRLLVGTRVYGGPRNLDRLLTIARRHLQNDRVPDDHVAVVAGGMDGVERVLQAHLAPGDAVAVEDPGYPGVLDLVPALGFVPLPVALDRSGPRPESLATALAAGARAVVLTPRAQNPTGAALDRARVTQLRRVLDRHADVVVVEDDHAGAIGGAEGGTLAGRRRWAVIRSVSKTLGPDLRLAILAGDATTVARVEGRQQLGTGWVSHVLQHLVTELWTDRATTRLVASAAAAYQRRRSSLLRELAAVGLEATGASGLNVWVPVREEQPAVAGLLERGWAVAAGERYRLQSGPGLRITISTLEPPDARRLAHDLAAVLEPRPTTRPA